MVVSTIDEDFKLNDKIIRKLLNILWHGKGAERQAAATKLGRFAQEGNILACENLVKYYVTIEKDYKLAQPWIELGMKLGSGVCEIYLAKCYELGLGIKKDERLARRIYSKHANNGDKFALYSFADMLLKGTGGECDVREAINIFTKLANTGYTKAKYRLGDIYNLGQGIRKNEELALQWYKEAAKDKMPKAYLAIGSMYYYGNGVEQDTKKGMEYYALGARYNQKIGLYKLGKGYYTGSGVEQDTKHGIKLLLKASKVGEKKSKEYLESIGYNVDEKQVQENIKEFFESDRGR